MVEEEKPRSKTFGAILIVVIFIFLVIVPAYIWLFQTEHGKRTVTDVQVKIKTQLDKIPLAFTKLYEEQKVIAEWETESNVTKEKLGVIFEKFELVGSKVIEAGDTLMYRYVLDVKGVDEEIDLTLTCIPPQDIVEGEVKVSEAKAISEIPHSYSNLVCEFTTKSEIDRTAVVVKGGLSFPFTTETKLKVYFITEDAYKELVPKGKSFFEVIGSKETLPIKSDYHNEPVGVALVAADVSEELAQPVVIAERFSPIIGVNLIDKWGEGKVKDIEDFMLYLPQGIEIINENPTKLCPFKKEGIQTRKGIKYEADNTILKKIPPFGGEKGLYQKFRCKIAVTDNAIAADPTKPSYYYADVSYTYEYDPKPAESITIKSKEAEETI